MLQLQSRHIVLCDDDTVRYTHAQEVCIKLNFSTNLAISRARHWFDEFGVMLNLGHNMHVSHLVGHVKNGPGCRTNTAMVK